MWKNPKSCPPKEYNIYEVFGILNPGTEKEKKTRFHSAFIGGKWMNIGGTAVITDRIIWWLDTSCISDPEIEEIEDNKIEPDTSNYMYP